MRTTKALLPVNAASERVKWYALKDQAAACRVAPAVQVCGCSMHNPQKEWIVVEAIRVL